MKALVFRVGAAPVLEEIDGFKGIKKTVAGFVARIVLQHLGRRGSDEIQLWCDDDGMPRGLKPNLWAQGPHYEGAPVLGTAIVCAARVVDDDFEFRDLTESEIEVWSLLRARQ